MASRARVCRFCRSVVDQTKAINLFTSTSALKRWAPRLTGLLGIPVEKNDKISSYMCKQCSARVESLEKSVKDLAAFRAMAKCSLDRVVGPLKQSSGSGHVGASPGSVGGPLKRAKETSGIVGVSPDTVRERPRPKTPRRRFEFCCKYYNNKMHGDYVFSISQLHHQGQPVL